MTSTGARGKVRFGVFPLERRWLLFSMERRLGLFEDEMSALRAGQSAARQAIGDGMEAELYHMDARGRLHRALPASLGH